MLGQGTGRGEHERNRGVERHWWLALAVFRWVSLGYAFVVFARTTDDYARPTGAALVLAGWRPGPWPRSSSTEIRLAAAGPC